jgi:hypothetical protein
MSDRPIPYNVQSGVVTQLLIELTGKHPELLKEIKERLAELPYPVERFIFLELTHRSHPYDLKELTKPWMPNSTPAKDTTEPLSWRRGNIPRPRR